MTSVDLAASLDVVLREALFDVHVARKVVTDLPAALCYEPPRHAAHAALVAVTVPDLQAIDPAMVMHRVMADRLPGWDDTCRWLAEVTVGGYGPGTVGWHLRALQEHHAKRELSVLAARANQAAETDVDGAVRLLQDGLTRIETRTYEAPPSVGDLLPAHLEHLETVDTTRIQSTGLPDLDHLLAGGLRPGQLVVVGARPGAGKSLLLGGLARQAAIHDGQVVLFASLEMDRRELVNRVLAAEAGVSLSALQAQNLDADAWSRLSRHLSVLSESRLHIDDTPTQTVPGITGTARPLHPVLVCVDYLQLLTSTGKTNNRQEEVATLSRSLKLMARELSTTVVAAAQLNRASDGRQDKKPRVSDLRESGAIEADADLVLLIDRDENDDTQGTDATLIVAKNRSGPTGSVPLVFSGDVATFRSAWRAA